jgi:hypothetical protein
MVLITIVTGDYKPTNITGGPTLYNIVGIIIGLPRSGGMVLQWPVLNCWDNNRFTNNNRSDVSGMV